LVGWLYPLAEGSLARVDLLFGVAPVASVGFSAPVEEVDEAAAVAGVGGEFLDAARQLADQLTAVGVALAGFGAFEVVPEGADVQGEGEEDAVDGGHGRGNARLPSEFDRA
jgi:hypothetical protein